MNFVFFSPHFPASGTDFCDRLKKAGATVLGIGDAPYDEFDPKLKQALSEHYRIADMENHNAVFRADGHFIHKWGQPNRSNAGARKPFSEHLLPSLRRREPW